MRIKLKPYVDKSLWLPNIPPRKGIVIAAFSALICIVIAAHMVLQQPSSGIDWTPTRDNSGLIINRAPKSLPLVTGICVVGIKALDGKYLSVHNDMLLEDPDQYATYADYNAFFKEQRDLMEIFTQETVVLVIQDGREYSLNTNSSRRLEDLPISFWLLNISAAACFLIGCNV